VLISVRAKCPKTSQYICLNIGLYTLRHARITGRFSYDEPHLRQEAHESSILRLKPVRRASDEEFDGVMLSAVHIYGLLGALSRVREYVLTEL